MSLQRRHAKQHRVAFPVARMLHLCSVRIMKLCTTPVKRDLARKRPRIPRQAHLPLCKTPAGNIQKGLEREASDSYWYLATCNFCAHAERLRLKTGRARAHLDCISGQNVRICSTVPPEETIYFCQHIIVGTARLQDNSQRALWHAFASRDLIELDH